MISLLLLVSALGLALSMGDIAITSVGFGQHTDVCMIVSGSLPAQTKLKVTASSMKSTTLLELSHPFVTGDTICLKDFPQIDALTLSPEDDSIQVYLSSSMTLLDSITFGTDVNRKSDNGYLSLPKDASGFVFDFTSKDEPPAWKVVTVSGIAKVEGFTSKTDHSDFFGFFTTIGTNPPSSAPSSEPSSAPSSEPSTTPSTTPSSEPSTEPSSSPSEFCETYDVIIDAFVGVQCKVFSWFIVENTVVHHYITDSNDYFQWEDIPDHLVLASSDSNTFDESYCVRPEDYIVAAFLVEEKDFNFLSLSTSVTQCSTFQFSIGPFSGFQEICDEFTPAIFSTSTNPPECDNSKIAMHFSLNHSSSEGEKGWYIYESGASEPVLVGFGQADLNLCLNDNVHVLVFSKYEDPSSIPYAASYAVKFACADVIVSSGTITVDAANNFVLFDLKSLSCELDEYPLELLLDYGTDPSVFQIVLSTVDNSQVTSIAIGDGKGAHFCGQGGTYLAEVYACNETINDAAFQIGVDGTVQALFPNFTLSMSYFFELDAREISATPAPMMTCGDGEVEHRLLMDFDTKPEETEWMLTHISDSGRNASIIARGNDKTDSMNLLCLGCGETYILSVVDCGGNGMCCENGFGKYMLLNDVENTIIALGGEFAYSQRTTFTVGCY